MRVVEKYYLLERGEKICRYGAFGLTREYFDKNALIPPVDGGQLVDLEVPAAKIKVLQAVITSSCNLQCSYCSFAANGPKLTLPKMSRDEIDDLWMRFNRDIGPEGLLLITGGEPELYPEAVDRLADNISGKIILFTNGTLTTRERLKYYQAKGVGVLFSLDGDLFSHDTARLTKGGSYTRVAQALKEASDLGMDFGISAVVGDHNIEKLPELVTFIYNEFHPASLGLNLPHNYGATWNRIEEYTRAMLEIFAWSKRTGLFIDQINRRLAPLVERKFRFRDCAAQGEKVVAFPGGLCTSCVNQAALGDRIVDWAHRLPVNDLACHDCMAIGICGGGCIFDGESINGEGRFDQRNCHFTRELLTYMIWDFWDELRAQANDPQALRERYGALLHRSGGTQFSVGHEPA